jgi:hypothetical protein
MFMAEPVHGVRVANPHSLHKKPGGMKPAGFCKL